METSILYKGCTIEIEQDPDPMNPRTEYDNLGTMICCHKRYNLGISIAINIQTTIVGMSLLML